MSEQTLLVLLLAILTISWVSIAVVVVFIGMRVLRVLTEVEMLAARLRVAGEAAAADVAELRERLRAEGSKVRGIVDFVLGFAMRKVSSRRRLKKPPHETLAE